MKTRIITALASLCLASSTFAGFVVYQNNTTDLGYHMDLSNAEIGDEISLANGGSAYTLNSFEFEFFGTGLIPGAQMRLRLYNNDGTTWNDDPTILRPSSLIYDSGLFDVANTMRSTIRFDESNTPEFAAGVNVPSHFTWSLQISGMSSVSSSSWSAGPELYSPPTVGNGYRDFWYRTGGGTWVLLNGEAIGLGESFRVDMGAVLTAVPEPSNFLAALLVLPLLGLWKLRRSSALQNAGQSN